MVSHDLCWHQKVHVHIMWTINVFQVNSNIIEVAQLMWSSAPSFATLLLFLKGIGSVYKWHPVTKFEHGNHGASKWKFNHMTVY